MVAPRISVRLYSVPRVYLLVRVFQDRRYYSPGRVGSQSRVLLLFGRRHHRLSPRRGLKSVGEFGPRSENKELDYNDSGGPYKIRKIGLRPLYNSRGKSQSFILQFLNPFFL